MLRPLLKPRCGTLERMLVIGEATFGYTRVRGKNAVTAPVPPASPFCWVRTGAGNRLCFGCWRGCAYATRGRVLLVGARGEHD